MADPVQPASSVVIDQRALLESLGKAHAMLDMREQLDAMQNEQIRVLTAENERLRRHIETLEAKGVAADIVAEKRRGKQ